MKKRDCNMATSHALFDDQQDEFVGCGVGATRPMRLSRFGFESVEAEGC